MLGDPAMIDAICDTLGGHAAGIALVVDPVMIAKGGASLLAADAVAHLRDRLLPMASLVTPNLPEAEALTGLAIADEAAMRRAADALLRMGMPAVLLKGGHLSGETVVDLLATSEGVEAFRNTRIATRHTHGTGCTLASAIASGLAQGAPLREAVIRARAYVRAAIAEAPGFGHGHGPLNHVVPAI
jgi:hydroxymethylpyrimidine/phosphomethylpyrimidine kinase